MRIGLVVPGFSANEDDWCIPALLNLVRVLAQDHDVHVFTLRYPHIQGVYQVYGATVHAFGGATVGGIGRLPLLFRVVRHILRTARHQPFDLLHGLWADEPGYVATIAAGWLHIPALVSIMGGELVRLPQIEYGHQLSRSGRWMIRRSLRKADGVTVGSQTLYERACDVVDANKLMVAPLGVDSVHFKPGRSQQLSGEVKLLQVASLTPIKNQAMSIRILAHLPAGYDLHLVGDGADRPALERLSRQLGVDDRVVFHGAVTHDDLPAYYHAADVCLLTSVYESQSMVALEAGAMGKVTIGTTVGILPELIPNDLLVVDDHDAGLARNIIQLIENQSLRHNLETHVYDLVTSQFVLPECVLKLQHQYQQLL